LIIQTVYRPEENIKFLDDWLNHHTAIGVKHFYLYDNGGSLDDNLFPNLPRGMNKHHYCFEYDNLDEIREKESKILSRYPVTKIMWQPKNKDGSILYGQYEAIYHFSNIVKSGLCAFVDIDEFIIKKEEFYPSRMFQKKFRTRHEYESVYDCYDACNIDTSKMDTKVILDMSNIEEYLKNNSTHRYQNIHFQGITNLPIAKNYYNHYNHAPFTHKILTKDMLGWMDPDKEMAKKIPPYGKVFYKVEETGLQKFF
jgi:hypothetical protein